MAKLRVRWPIGIIERLAIFWPGARVFDVVQLDEKHKDAGGWLVHGQQKTGGKASIPCSRKLPDFAGRILPGLAFLH